MCPQELVSYALTLGKSEKTNRQKTKQKPKKKKNRGKPEAYLSARESRAHSAGRKSQLTFSLTSLHCSGVSGRGFHSPPRSWLIKEERELSKNVKQKTTFKGFNLIHETVIFISFTPHSWHFCLISGLLFSTVYFSHGLFSFLLPGWLYWIKPTNEQLS